MKTIGCYLVKGKRSLRKKGGNSTFYFSANGLFKVHYFTRETKKHNYLPTEDCGPIFGKQISLLRFLWLLVVGSLSLCIIYVCKMQRN